MTLPELRNGESAATTTTRSRKWTPLAYPKSAFETDRQQTPNAFFPLHRDVLLATTRELLILDKTLESETLSLSKEYTQFVDTEQQNKQIVTFSYSRHLDPKRYIVDNDAKDDNDDSSASASTSSSTQGTGKRRRTATSEETVSSGKKLRLDDETSEDLKPVLCDALSLFQICKIPSPEVLADIIVNRARLVPAASSKENLADNTCTDANNCDDGSTRPRRKVSVSDSDAPEIEPQPEMIWSSSLEQTATSLDDDICCFFNISERNLDGSMKSLGKQLPDIIHASVSTEAILCDATHTMVEKMVESFSDKTLNLFLGYKISNVPRRRLVRMLAGYLFDTSHAMFAWEQTESELPTCNKKNVSANKKQYKKQEKVDAKVCSSLFDARALKRIGGFNPSSILPHAISIARQRRDKMGWEAFARTFVGRRMLKHHRSGESVVVVGRTRRGQRVRQQRWTIQNDLVGSIQRTRSRSSSIVSCDGEEQDSVVAVTPQLAAFHELPSVRVIRLTKKPWMSWGVVLSKEGEMCVVVEIKDKGAQTDELRAGDLIIHAVNENGEEAGSPMYVTSPTIENRPDWFRSMVNIFKQGQEITVTVQRVVACAK